MASDAVSLAKILWNYHKLNQPISKADCIFVLGSHDTKVAERGAEIWLAGFAPYLLFSGAHGRLTEDWNEPEAEVFAQVAIKMGVPEEKIIKETQATNTQENVVLSHKLLDRLGHHFQSFILVQKPYMERRALATFQKNWPEAEAIVTSPSITFEDNAAFTDIDKLINILVGDTLRLKIYGERGYLVGQKIPPKVRQAYEHLVRLGYTTYVIPVN